MPRRKLLHYCMNCDTISSISRDTEDDKDGIHFHLSTVDEPAECPHCKNETAFAMHGGFVMGWVKGMLIRLHKRLKKLEADNKTIVEFVKSQKGAEDE